MKGYRCPVRQSTNGCRPQLGHIALLDHIATVHALRPCRVDMAAKTITYIGPERVRPRDQNDSDVPRMERGRAYPLVLVETRA